MRFQNLKMRKEEKKTKTEESETHNMVSPSRFCGFFAHAAAPHFQILISFSLPLSFDETRNDDYYLRKEEEKQNHENIVITLINFPPSIPLLPTFF